MKPIRFLKFMIVLLFLIVINNGTPDAHAQGVETPTSVTVNSKSAYFTSETITYADGTSLDEYIINGPPTPPKGYEIERQAVTLPETDRAAGIVTLTVPAYEWSFGCSATSGAMIAAYYDRNGASNMYTGPTNGGLMPLDSSSWPNWTDGYGETWAQCPLTASRNGLDGRTTPGSIDDYWVTYGSTELDPYITGGWTQHAWGDAIGDYMGTSQSAYDNPDGSTSFTNWKSNPDQLTCSTMVYYGLTSDGTYGRKLFYGARGYTVTDCYNQRTDDNNGGGFTFAMYKAEIDAGRPVMLNLYGHTVVGVGYDDFNQTVYLHDTWDYGTHTMTWGGSYAGRQLLSVSIVNISSNPVPTLTSLSPSSITAGNATFTLTVNGSNFVNGSIINWNSTALTTTYVSGTKLTASIDASKIAAAGTVPVTVFNPAPGGGLTSALTFTINNPVPTLTSLSPSSITAGNATFTLTVNGSNFVNGSIVRWNGADLATTYVSSTKLTASIDASKIATAGTAPVTVFNPTPGGGTTSAVTFTINNPVPTLTNLSPSSALVGGAGFTLTVNGTNFVTGSVIKWNNTSLATAYVNSSQLTASIDAARIASVGTASVTVYNPTPGGGTTAAQTFTINNPIPTLATLSPSSATAGGATFTLTVTGANFVSGSVIRWNGVALTTNRVNSTQLTASVAAAKIATSVPVNVTVFTATPGGGESSALPFTINNPVPTLTSLSPSSITAGNAAFTLTVNGTNFVNGSSILWNGTALATTYVSSTKLTASIDASKIATGGIVPVTVFNPAPGGDLTSALTFTVNNPAPTLSSLSPSSATAGGAGFTLTVTGTKFVPSSVIRWDGADLATTFISATQISASIDAAKIATGGTPSVTVFNPTPGGGTTSASAFTINNPVPTLTSLSPSSAAVGGAGFTLTVNGTNFVTASVIKWNGTSLATAYVNSSQLTANIDASRITSLGIANVTVFNPTPVGGTSSAQTFAIINPVPTLATLSPYEAAPGGAAFTLTVTGTNFVPASVIRWNGADQATTWGSSTQLTASIDATLIDGIGTVEVTVFNPTPGGGESSPLSFHIGRPMPVLISLGPSSVTVGDPGFTLTVYGSHFEADSIIRWNGVDLATTFVNDGELTAVIDSSDMAACGVISITVYTPDPGGIESDPLKFLIVGEEKVFLPFLEH